MSEKSVHQLNIAQNRGGRIRRIYHYIKPERARNFSVKIKNLETQSTWGYDKYHLEIEDGKYVIIFSNPECTRDYTCEIEITPQSGANINIVYSWIEFAASFSHKIVTDAEFDELVDAKKLGLPMKYQGY